jgi:putative transposase
VDLDTGADRIELEIVSPWWRQIKRYFPEMLESRGVEKGFQVLPRRWVVERTVAWVGRYRRLSKDYERLCATAETLIYSAMSRLMCAASRLPERIPTRSSHLSAIISNPTVYLTITGPNQESRSSSLGRLPQLQAPRKNHHNPGARAWPSAACYRCGTVRMRRPDGEPCRADVRRQ